MAGSKQKSTDEGPSKFYELQKYLKTLSLAVCGPLFLIYLNLRCEKNQCVLLQLPLVIPTHLGAYFSPLSACIVLGFLSLTMFFSQSSRPPKIGVSTPTLSPGLGSLTAGTWLLLAVAYIRPHYIQMIYEEYLRLLCTTTMLCIGFSALLYVFNELGIVNKDRELSFLNGFYYGQSMELTLLNVELKYFFYVHVGMVAWALLDLLIVINYFISKPLTTPLIFLTISQYVFVVHTLMFEQFIKNRPFTYTEGLGFSWLMRVLMYQPFFQSLPVLYAASTGIVLPRPAMLAYCVLFLFGFVIYMSSVHQKERFVSNPDTYKRLKSVQSANGNRMLVGGYWGIVQKPDYLGFTIIWLSWGLACGMSALSVLVILTMYMTVLTWLRQTQELNKGHLTNVNYERYNRSVPYKIIPYIY